MDRNVWHPCACLTRRVACHEWPGRIARGLRSRRAFSLGPLAGSEWFDRMFAGVEREILENRGLGDRLVLLVERDAELATEIHGGGDQHQLGSGIAC